MLIRHLHGAHLPRVIINQSRVIECRLCPDATLLPHLPPIQLRARCFSSANQPAAKALIHLAKTSSEFGSPGNRLSTRIA